MGHLLHVRGHVTGLVLHGPREPGVDLLGPQRDPGHRDRRGQHDQPERPIEVDENRDHDEDLEDVHQQEHQSEPEEPSDGRQVRGDPGQQLTGLPPGVECQWEPLELGVELHPDVRLYSECRLRDDPSTAERQQRFTDPDGDRGRAERVQAGTVRFRNRTVDDAARHQRHQNAGGDSRDGEHDHQHEAPAIRAQVGPEPPDRRGGPLGPFAIPIVRCRTERHSGGRAAVRGHSAALLLSYWLARVCRIANRLSHRFSPGADPKFANTRAAVVRRLPRDAVRTTPQPPTAVQLMVSPGASVAGVVGAQVMVESPPLGRSR